MRNRVRVGDVINNLWASDKNPLRTSIVNNIDKDFVYCIYLHKNKICKAKYSRYEVNKDAEHFVIKGHINLYELLENELNKFI